MKQTSFKPVLPHSIAVISLIVGFIIVLLPILSGVFYFTFDQGRDLIWVRNQIEFHKPSMIGPWGSLTGLFFGPLWYWLLTPAYILTGGNPIGVTIFNALIVFGSIAFLFFLLKKYSLTVAVFVTVIAAFSQGIHGIASYEFSEHILPVLTIVLLYSFTQILLIGKQRFVLVALLAIALMYHAQPAMTALSLPSLGIVIWLSPYRHLLLNLKTLALSCIVFSIPFLPSLLFDLKHDFLQTKAVINFFTNKNTGLGDILPFSLRLLDRPKVFFSVFEYAVFNRFTPIALLLLLTTTIINYKAVKDLFLRSLWKTSLLYVGSLFFLFILYPPQLKPFYLDGLLPIFILWVALSLSILWLHTQYRFLVVIGLVILVVWNTQPSAYLRSYQSQFDDKKSSGSVFANQQAIIDWVYQDAHSHGFNVYTYVPAVYDYPYQYLFMWYGVSKYGYLPEEFAYLPNQPEYVQLKSQLLTRFSTKIKPSEDYFYLIIEPDDYIPRKEVWLQQFPKDQYPLLQSQEFPDKTIVEKRQLKSSDF